MYSKSKVLILFPTTIKDGIKPIVIGKWVNKGLKPLEYIT